MKMMVPTEQALSMAMLAADAMGRADTLAEGVRSRGGEDALRILTPLVKFRACRDNVPVATGAMEVRGGDGYIEEWVNAAPDPRRAGRPAVGRHQQHQRARRRPARGRQGGRAHALRALAGAAGCRTRRWLPPAFVGAPATALDRIAHRLGRSGRARRPRWRATGAARGHRRSIMSTSADPDGVGRAPRPGADARRVLLARFVLDHRLSAQDPLALEDAAWEQEATALLLDTKPVALAKAGALAVA